MTPEENISGKPFIRKKPTFEEYHRECLKLYRAYVTLKECPKCGYPYRPGWTCTYCGWSGE